MSPPCILRYASFTDDPAAGNPAGVVLDADDMSEAEMQQVATDGAALGGHLRELGLVAPPARATIVQGEDFGRSGRLEIEIGERGGIPVTGAAVRI